MCVIFYGAGICAAPAFATFSFDITKVNCFSCIRPNGFYILAPSNIFKFYGFLFRFGMINWKQRRTKILISSQLSLCLKGNHVFLGIKSAALENWSVSASPPPWTCHLGLDYMRKETVTGIHDHPEHICSIWRMILLYRSSPTHITHPKLAVSACVKCQLKSDEFSFTLTSREAQGEHPAEDVQRSCDESPC